MDNSAQDNPRKDLNGNLCALLKVMLASPDAEFSGDIVSPAPEYRDGEYWVYMTGEDPSARFLHIWVPGYLPLDLDFEDFKDVGSLHSGVTYRLEIEMPAKQENDSYYVKRLKPLSFTIAHDNSAKKWRRNDIYGNPCALVKVALASPKAELAGDIFGAKPEYVRSEYWVYMSTKNPVARYLRIYLNGFLPLNIDLKDYNEYPLSSGNTYRLKVDMTAQPVHLDHAQELKVIGFSEDNSDKSAKKAPKNDKNKRVCSLVKVKIPSAGVDFSGDIVKPALEYNDKKGEYWVYLTRENPGAPKSTPVEDKSARFLNVYVDGYQPLYFDFEKYADIGLLKPGVTYRLELENPVASNNGSEKVYQYSEVDVKPEYTGGIVALENDISQLAEYPFLPLESNLRGTVTVKFVVNKDGSIGEVRVLSGIDPSHDKQAVLMVKALDKFLPGKVNGQNVNVWYNMTIDMKKTATAVNGNRWTNTDINKDVWNNNENNRTKEGSILNKRGIGSAVKNKKGTL